MEERQVIRCHKCADLILVFKTLMKRGDVINEHSVEPHLGQGPFTQGQMANCGKCGEPFGCSESDITIEMVPVAKH